MKLMSLGLLMLLAACGQSSGAGTSAQGGDSQTAATIPDDVERRVTASPHPVGHTGRWLIDAWGRVVMVHGVNVVPTAPATSATVSDDAIRFLAAHGFTVVRLGWQVSALEPQPGHYDEQYLQTLVDTVNRFARYGIYTLVDMHQDEWGPSIGIRGFPAWMTLDDGLPAPPTGQQHPIGYWTSPAINRAFKNFWANKPVADGRGVQDVLAAQWQHVASRFVGNPAVIGYDILNEPYPGEDYPYPLPCWSPLNTGCPAFDQVLARFYNRLITAVHAIDPDHLAFYEPAQYTYTGVPNYMPKPAPSDEMSGISMHAYCLEALGLPKSPITDLYCNPAFNNVFSGTVAHSSLTGSAILFTEFGATTDPGYWTELTALSDQYLVPWILWDYTDVAGSWSQAPQPNASILTAVERPYPMAVAGTPLAISFDPSSKLFALRYATTSPASGAPPDANTDIYVPSLQYPSGYQVQVSGASVVSAPGNSHLLLRTTKAASEVSVSITPK